MENLIDASYQKEIFNLSSLTQNEAQYFLENFRKMPIYKDWVNTSASLLSDEDKICFALVRAPEDTSKIDITLLHKAIINTFSKCLCELDPDTISDFEKKANSIDLSSLASYLKSTIEYITPVYENTKNGLVSAAHILAVLNFSRGFPIPTSTKSFHNFRCTTQSFFYLNLSGLNLNKINFLEGNLQHIDFTDCNLTSANLDQANLSYARIHNTNFSETTLKQTLFGNASMNDKTYFNGTLKDYLSVQFLPAPLYSIKIYNLDELPEYLDNLQKNHLNPVAQEEIYLSIIKNIDNSLSCTSNENRLSYLKSARQHPFFTESIQKQQKMEKKSLLHFSSFHRPKFLIKDKLDNLIQIAQYRIEAKDVTEKLEKINMRK